MTNVNKCDIYKETKIINIFIRISKIMLSIIFFMIFYNFYIKYFLILIFLNNALTTLLISPLKNS